jgi:hypothetical protein
MAAPARARFIPPAKPRIQLRAYGSRRRHRAPHLSRADRALCHELCRARPRRRSLAIAVTAAARRRLAKLQPLAGAQNPAVEMAHLRWSIIEKHDRAWLAGQEPPVEGTPLAAWNALNPEQADVLRANSIKTVEEVAALTDAHIARLPLPNLREVIRQARPSRRALPRASPPRSVRSRA